jgi:hypothetical protein
MSFFIGQTGLRHQWATLTYSDVASATDAASSVLLARLQRGGRFAYFDNSINVDLALYLVHPDADPAVTANRLFWIEIPATRVINYDFLQQIQVQFDPGTRIYVSKAAGAGSATSGKLRLSTYA